MTENDKHLEIRLPPPNMGYELFRAGDNSITVTVHADGSIWVFRNRHTAPKIIRPDGENMRLVANTSRGF